MATRDRKELHERLQEEGKTGYVTPTMVEAEWKSAAYHHFEGTTVTVCCLTLRNGFTVVGQSACANPDNFDPKLGRELAFEDANQQIYKFLAFRLCDEAVPMEAIK